MTVSEAIARAAAARKESRGAHFREDFASKDKEWGKTTLVVRKGPDGNLQLLEDPLSEMPPELKQIVQEQE